MLLDAVLQWFGEKAREEGETSLGIHGGDGPFSLCLYNQVHVKTVATNLRIRIG